jgi:DNA-binding CsgD family transcriptional regulator
VWEALTPRERELAPLLRAGLQYKEIADKFWISVHTVTQEISHLYRKLGVHTKTDAINRLYPIG